MTITFDHHGNGATDEADVVATGTDYGSTWNNVTKVGSPTCKYDTAHAIHSTTSIRWTRPTTSDSGYLLAQVAGTARLQTCTYVWLDALPAAQLNLQVFRSSTFAGYVCINVPGSTAGRIGVLTAGSVSVPASVSSADFPIGQWVRVEAAFTKGTTTSNGRAELAYYLGDSTTPVVTPYDSGATFNAGTLDLTGCRFGINGVTTTPPSVWFARPRMGDAASGFIGPIVPSPDRDWMTWTGTAWE